MSSSLHIYNCKRALPGGQWGKLGIKSCQLCHILQYFSEKINQRYQSQGAISSLIGGVVSVGERDRHMVLKLLTATIYYQFQWKCEMKCEPKRKCKSNDIHLNQLQIERGELMEQEVGGEPSD